MGSPPVTDVVSSIEYLRSADSRLEAAVNRTVETGGTDAFAAPSRLPDWTIGHVVTHLARNADGLRRVLDGVTAGQQLQPYDSPQARADDIQAGARAGHPHHRRGLPRGRRTTRAHHRRARAGTLVRHRRPRPRRPHHRRCDPGRQARRGGDPPPRPGRRRRPRAARRRPGVPAAHRAAPLLRPDPGGARPDPAAGRAGADRHRSRWPGRRGSGAGHRGLAERPRRRLRNSERRVAFPSCRPGEYGERHEQRHRRHQTTPATSTRRARRPPANSPTSRSPSCPSGRWTTTPTCWCASTTAARC